MMSFTTALPSKMGARCRSMKSVGSSSYIIQCAKIESQVALECKQDFDSLLDHLQSTSTCTCQDHNI